MQRPIKILQFGEGNFLRAFVDWMVDIVNEQGMFDGDIAIVKPIEYGNLEAFTAQGCAYGVLLRGKENGKMISQSRTITSIAKALDCCSNFDEFMAFAKIPELRFIISNTTEAGIVFDETDQLNMTPPNSFPVS